MDFVELFRTVAREFARATVHIAGEQLLVSQHSGEKACPVNTSVVVEKCSCAPVSCQCDISVSTVVCLCIAGFCLFVLGFIAGKHRAAAHSTSETVASVPPRSQSPAKTASPKRDRRRAPPGALKWDGVRVA